MQQSERQCIGTDHAHAVEHYPLAAPADIGMKVIDAKGPGGIICGVLPNACIYRDEAGEQHITEWANVMLDNVKPVIGGPVEAWAERIRCYPQLATALNNALWFALTDMEVGRLANELEAGESTPDMSAMRSLAEDELIEALHAVAVAQTAAR